MQQIMNNRLIDQTLSQLESKAESAISKSVLETFQIALGEIQPSHNPLINFSQEVQKQFWLQLLQIVGYLRACRWQSNPTFKPFLAQVDTMTEQEFEQFLSWIFLPYGIYR